jgi:tetratricopeptide (TPR) repeat protein
LGFQYDVSVDRALSRAGELAGRLEKGRSLLQACLEEHKECPEALLSRRMVRRLPAWVLVEALLEASLGLRYRDPRRMLELAHFAKLAAEKLEPFPNGTILLADLQAKAWIGLANARRVNDDFQGAERALVEAKAHLVRGSGEPLLVGRLAEIEAALLRNQRRLDAALRLLAPAYGSYVRLGERHLAGRVRVAMGACTLYDGDFRQSVAYLQEGVELIEPNRDPPLTAAARMNLIDALCSQGDFRRAGELFLKAGLRREFQHDPLNLLKLRWLEGKIHAGLERLARAAHVLEEVHAELTARDRAYDAALVGLDLAAVCFRQGKFGRVRELAKAKLETLHSLGVRREAVRAIGFLHEACERQRVTVAEIVSVRQFLARLEWRPYLRFRGV